MQLQTMTQRMLDQALKGIESAQSMDSAAEKLQGLVTKATSGRQVKNLLSGVWLGHPAHPPMTDVPIGAFTSAAVLDLFSKDWSRRAADALIATGLVTIVPTAAAGANDWSDTQGGTRRIGMAHASANGLAGVLYGASLLQRRRGNRSAGLTLGFLGWLTLLVGGTLGGHLAYRRGIGVDENAFLPGLDDWQPTIAETDLPENEPQVVTAGSVDILLVRTGGVIRAVADRCSHLGGPLHNGNVHVSEGQISCPWHNSTFNLADGSVVRGPASAPQPCYETRLRDGTIEVRQTHARAG